MGEKLVGGQILWRDLIGHSRNVFFELFYFVALVLEQNVLRDQEMEEFLFNFRVHQNPVRDINQQLVPVDIPLKPGLPRQVEYHIQRHHILALYLLPGSYTLLVRLSVPLFGQVLDQWDKDVLWVVLFEFQLRVVVSLGRVQG